MSEKRPEKRTVFTEMYTLLDKHIEICMRKNLDLPAIDFEHPNASKVERFTLDLSSIDIEN